MGEESSTRRLPAAVPGTPTGADGPPRRTLRPPEEGAGRTARAVRGEDAAVRCIAGATAGWPVPTVAATGADQLMPEPTARTTKSRARRGRDVRRRGRGMAGSPHYAAAGAAS